MEELENFSTTTADDLRSKLQGELRKLEEKLEELRPQFEEVKTRVHNEAKKAKGKVEDQVKQNPWATIGVVGLIFFVLGCLFGSRRSD
jgi:ElaB/YqjD/DUF883 family membrane-anchored ribosome-binding protein